MAERGTKNLVQHGGNPPERFSLPLSTAVRRRREPAERVRLVIDARVELPILKLMVLESRICQDRDFVNDYVMICR